MSEKELFNEVLQYFVDYYRLTIERPYNDGYMIIKRGNEEIGSFNSDGYNLLRNLSQLCNTLKGELL